MPFGCVLTSSSRPCQPGTPSCGVSLQRQARGLKRANTRVVASIKGEITCTSWRVFVGGALFICKQETLSQQKRTVVALTRAVAVLDELARAGLEDLHLATLGAEPAITRLSLHLKVGKIALWHQIVANGLLRSRSILFAQDLLCLRASRLRIPRKSLGIKVGVAALIDRAEHCGTRLALSNLNQALHRLCGFLDVLAQ